MIRIKQSILSLTRKYVQFLSNFYFYFFQGFFLIVSPDSALEVAETALKNKKLFIMNISAPYICHAFNQHLLKLIPYVDILFGNETVTNSVTD